MSPSTAADVSAPHTGVVRHRTLPGTVRRAAPPPRRTPRVPWRQAPPAVAALVLLALVVGAEDLGGAGRLTLATFVVAVWAWAFSSLDDTFVALSAGTTLVLGGVLDSDRLFSTLGDDTVWLLVSAFVIAAGVTGSGLTVRAAAWLVVAARGPRSLVHLLTAALVVTAFAVPATSGRAALALPVFVALATALRRVDGHGPLVKALALLFPTVILLSAIGSLLGAGAHLVTVQILQTSTGESLGFASWLVLGLPLAVVSSHIAAEIVLRLFTGRSDRSRTIRVTLDDLAGAGDGPVSGPLTVLEGRAALLLGAVVLLWCTEPLHGLDPAIVALLGALVSASPRYGSTDLKQALKTIPWSLLLFMAATLALGDALVTSGAADWLAEATLGGLSEAGRWPFLIAVVLISTAAHLVIQSRSARAAVLVPIVVALAPTVGVSPMAAAFASTAAAGFCHTLPASAKPVTLFSDVPGVPTYAPADLRRLSVVLAPVTAALVLLFSAFVWPYLGLPL